MNESLLVFQSRESGFLNYRVPTNDRLDDAGTIPTDLLDTPVLLSVVLGTLAFSTVSGATSYSILRRIEGGDWTIIATVADEDAPEITFSDDGLIIAPAFYRVQATDGIRFSLESNTILLELTTDESSVAVRDICTLGIAEDVLATRMRIFNYAPGSIINAPGTPSGGPEYDGSLNFIFTPAEFSGLRPNWVSGEPGAFVIGDKSFCRVQVYVECVLGGGVIWWMIFHRSDVGGPSLWTGKKLGGDSPVGIYEYIGGEEIAPPWFGVEAADGATSPAISETCGIPGNVEWALLNWQAQNISAVNGATASFDPAVEFTDSDTATSIASCTSDPASEAHAEAFGYLTRNGGAINGKLSVTWTNPTPGASDKLVAFLQAYSNYPSDTALAVEIFADQASGSYEYPFTLPDTGGDPATILVGVSSSLLSSECGARSQTLVVQVSTV